VAWLLGSAPQSHDVRLWARDEELVEVVNAQHRNPRYLASTALPPTVTATTALDVALDGAQAVVLATPSSAVRAIAARMAPYLGTTTPLVLLSKGVECDSGLLLLDVLAAELGNPARLAVLSGPNHAEEVVRGLPAATVIASTGSATAAFFQEAFVTPAFRVYTSPDTTGVQLCGAAKNIIALAVGMAAGVGFGDNTAALIMTRGLAEISRLVTILGGDPLTCMGLAGMGDLVATCTSPHSRNRSFGLALAQGTTLAQYEQQTHMVVEGALACKTVTDLAHKHGVELPISAQIRSVIWEGKPLGDTVEELTGRPAKPEFY
jgi:glycerol-3-phosphate dehydrogenase (NAD(P)+)